MQRDYTNPNDAIYVSDNRSFWYVARHEGDEIVAAMSCHDYDEAKSALRNADIDLMATAGALAKVREGLADGFIRRWVPFS